MNPNRNLPSKGENIGAIFCFTLLLQGEVSGEITQYNIQVAAYDFEQALENIQKRFPQLEPMLDELRIRKAGEDAIRLYTNGRV